MNDLAMFVNIIKGHFNNDEQFKRYQEQGYLDYPQARHINTVCNDKIINLPSDFKSIFLIEESYYTLKQNTNAMPHLFLISYTFDGIKLESYEIPSEYDNDSFTYENINKLDYNKLKKMEKFQPIIYKKTDNHFYGKSISMFSPVLKFTIEETFSDEMLIVSEIFEVNGKRTFGYDNPIEYKRK